MSSCPAAAVLEKLLDEELVDAARTEVTQHVQTCSACQVALERLTEAPPKPAGHGLSLRDDESFLVGLMHAPPAPRTARDSQVSSIAGYEILEELGQGASGLVYKARQLSSGRIVALKVLRTRGRAKSLARFRREVDALAWLNHPNLVRIHEVGECRGRPYLAMEFVAGGSLDRLFAAGPLPIEGAVGLVAGLARGIQAAHECGVVHRDLKPANVLLQVAEDSTPASSASRIRQNSGFETTRIPANSATLESAIPKIADFGLAKHLDSAASLTASGAILGTPYYMAPEQAEGKTRLIGPAADIYSLGAILYEALAGRPPFQGPSVAAVLEMVRSQPPVPLRQMRADVPAALEDVCSNCLEKEPARRYASARALAEQLDAFLASYRAAEPVVACDAAVAPASRDRQGAEPAPVERSLPARRLLRLPRGVALPVAGAVLCAAAAVLLAFGASWIGLGQVTPLESDFHVAGEQAIGSNLPTLTAAGEQRRPPPDKPPDELPEKPALPMPADPLPANPPGERAPEKVPAPAALEAPTWIEAARIRHEAAVRSLVLAPRGKGLFYGGEDGAIRFWDMDQRTERIGAHRSAIHALAVSPDGQTVAAVSRDGAVRLHSRTTGQVTAQLQLKGAGQPNNSALAYSPDGRTLAVGYVDALTILDVAAGKPHAPIRVSNQIASLVFVWEEPEERGKEVKVHRKPLKGRVMQVPASNGLTLAIGNPKEGCPCQLVDAGTGQFKTALQVPGVCCLDYCAREQLLAIGSKDKGIRLWDPAARKQIVLLRAAAPLTALAFTHEGKLLASAGEDGSIQVWDMTDGTCRATWRAHQGGVTALHFTADGSSLVSSGYDGAVVLWQATR